MKKLTKIMLSVAAATVVTAAMAVTAMAVDTITGTYDNTSGEVTMNGVIGSGTSQTLLVLNKVTENVTSSDIAYINQIDNSGTFSKFVLPAGLKSSAPVTYYIKIGGNDSSVELQTGTLTIAADAVTIIIGDVDGKDGVAAMDITRISAFLNGKSNPNQIKDTGKTKTKPDGTTIIVGDVDGKDGVAAMDITRISAFLNGKSNPNQIKDTGKSVEVLADN